MKISCKTLQNVDPWEQRLQLLNFIVKTHVQFANASRKLTVWCELWDGGTLETVAYWKFLYGPIVYVITLFRCHCRAQPNLKFCLETAHTSFLEDKLLQFHLHIFVIIAIILTKFTTKINNSMYFSKIFCYNRSTHCLH